VAVKLMRGELARSDQHRRRFGREAAAARAARSSHVVPILASGEWEGRPYLIQRFVSGGSLRDRLERTPRLELDESITVCAEVGSGLNALHENELIHRDVKPENILFDEQAGGLPKVTDFGLAVADDRAADELARAGTPAYMAPEQVEGASDLDPRADLYALGVMLYELLSGEPAWRGETVIAIAAARLLRPPPDIRAIMPNLSAQVATLLLRLMARQREDRPASDDPAPGELDAIGAALSAAVATPG